MRPRLGLIVNPHAGMGGSVGLKGSDGDRYREALARGARPLAGDRAAAALAALAGSGSGFELLTCGGAMGQASARSAGLDAGIAWQARRARTDASDTADAARALCAQRIDLLLFAGGDGTARDLLGAVAGGVPVLGVPAGVKMHSAVFAPGPRAAGDLAAAFLAGGCRREALRDAEVMDRDDDDASPRLFGTLPVPTDAGWTPHPKAGGGDDRRLDGACARVAALAADDRVTLIGPGSTMQAIKRRLGFDGTLLGIDAVQHGRPLALDLGEAGILELLEGRSGRIVVGVVGGQGFLLGRGNQPLSPAVIRRVGPGQLLVVASQRKLAALAGRPLLVDTGDEALDRELAGYIAVQVGATQRIQYRVAPASPVAGA